MSGTTDTATTDRFVTLLLDLAEQERHGADISIDNAAHRGWLVSKNDGVLEVTDHDNGDVYLITVRKG